MNKTVFALGTVRTVFTLIGCFNPARNGGTAHVVAPRGCHEKTVVPHIILAVPKIKEHVIIGIEAFKRLK